MTAIVFDLDGTLVESAPAIRIVANTFMGDRGLSLLSLEETRGYIGHGTGRFLERALRARNAYVEADFPAEFDVFRELHAAAPPEDNAPMPGSTAAMRALVASGFRLGLCTNKLRAPTRVIVDFFGWDQLLSVVITGESLPQTKPHPAPLLKAASDLGCSRTIYVGDSEVDAATAEAAAMPFVLYTQGYREAPVSSLPHAATFDNFEQLPAVLAEIERAGMVHGH